MWLGLTALSHVTKYHNMSVAAKYELAGFVAAEVMADYIVCKV